MTPRRRRRDLLELLESVARRLSSVATDLELVATVDIHRKNQIIGMLRTESAIVRTAVRGLRRGGGA